MKVAGIGPATLLKNRHSGTGIFLWILRYFQEHLLLKNISGGCFWNGFVIKLHLFVFMNNNLMILWITHFNFGKESCIYWRYVSLKSIFIINCDFRQFLLKITRMSISSQIKLKNSFFWILLGFNTKQLSKDHSVREQKPERWRSAMDVRSLYGLLKRSKLKESELTSNSHHRIYQTKSRQN